MAMLIRPPSEFISSDATVLARTIPKTQTVANSLHIWYLVSTTIPEWSYNSKSMRVLHGRYSIWFGRLMACITSSPIWPYLRYTEHTMSMCTRNADWQTNNSENNNSNSNSDYILHALWGSTPASQPLVVGDKFHRHLHKIRVLRFLMRRPSSHTESSVCLFL